MRLSIKTFAPAIIFLLVSGCNTLPAEILIQTEQPIASLSFEPTQSSPFVAAPVISQPPTAILPTAVAVVDVGSTTLVTSETRLGFNVRGWT